MSVLQQAIQERRKALGLPDQIDADRFPNLIALFDDIIQRYPNRPVFSCLGHTLTYSDLDKHANAFAAYLQNHTDLKAGDRIAIQLPNILQYPVVGIGALRAGLIVVNTNPLYTERELEHQLNDSGAKALVVLANVAATATKVIRKTQVKHVIVTELADLHPVPKRQVMNFVVKYIKKMVPEFHFSQSVRFTEVIKKGSKCQVKIANPAAGDVAILQYTGGTTGVAKGAMLTHRNMVANTLQSAEVFETYGLTNNGDIVVQPLPLYHIYAALVSFVVMQKGGHLVLIPNPRDLPALVKELSKWKFNGFCGLNTLFVALCNNEQFRALDFSSLRMTLSGGMALTRYAAEEWTKVTGKEVCEGYGLTETSPVVAVNTGNGNRVGTIGIAVPSTEIDIRGDNDASVGIGEPGELCIKGPQVMKGYWQRDDETRKTMKDGWLYSGDIAVMDADGYLKIVDRKKDMVIVSGFNVYPNEIEDVVTSHPAIVEAAAIGHKDEHSGEVVHVYVVKAKGMDVTEDELRSYCREKLAAYKVPKKVFFRDELPKSNVGKILRREVRAAAEAEQNKK